LLNYVTLVYSEEQLHLIKQKSLSTPHSSNAADMLLLPHDDEHSKTSGDLGKVVSGIKSGFGSFLSVFKDDKATKKPAPAKGKAGGSMMQQSLDESLAGTDRLSQSMMDSSYH
jgi:hypothetical protein